MIMFSIRAIFAKWASIRTNFWNIERIFGDGKRRPNNLKFGNYWYVGISSE